MKVHKRDAADELLTFEVEGPEVEIRSESKREIAIRIMRWNTIGRTAEGQETFEAGAFDGTDPKNVILRMEHEGPPAGRALLLERTEDGQTAVFKVAKTARGDELLTLAKDGYYNGASPSFAALEDGTEIRGRGSKRVIVRKKVDLREVSLTWRPTYEGTGVLYARNQEEAQVAKQEDPKPREDGDMDPQAVVPIEKRLSALEQRDMSAKDLQAMEGRLMKRLEALQERAAGTPTGAELAKPGSDVLPYRGDWMQGALTVMSGGDLTQLQKRSLADLITDDNAGVVPPAYIKELFSVIGASRPFIETTRKIDMPANGMQIIYPRVVTRPTVAIQAAEKTEVSSGPVTTETETANVLTYAGAGDISLQLLRRSDPSFLDLYLQLLAEAYATVTDRAALAALVNAGPEAGGEFDVEAGTIDLGGAFANSVAALKAPPDTLWVGTEVLSQMINARDANNQPLYQGVTGFGTQANANTTVFGAMLGLRMVWDPNIDALSQNIRAIVGPSRGFAWAEDGTFTLQADVPGRLGRDVALAGFMAFLPVYPAAFTTFTLAGESPS